MKRILSMIIALALVLSLATTAFATEGGEQPLEPPQEETQQGETPVVVSTLEELQAAVAAAEDGDTIAISKCIKLKNVSLVTDKDITLVPSDNSVGVLIEMSKGSQLSGFTLFTNACAVLISNYEGGEVTIANCVFVGNENYYNFLVNITGGTVQISDSDFQYGKDIALNISASCKVTVERCSFIGNTTIMQGAGIHNMGECYVEDSSFTNNTAGVGGGIYNSGTMEIIGCTYSGNKSTDTIFADVAPDAWYCPYVNTIANAGIVCGTGDGNFAPEAQLTWGHIITILSRFVEQQECDLKNIQYDGWAADAVETAVALGWITDHVAFNPDAPISRGELAYFINYVLGLYR